jgi:hypothetical protein
MPCNAVTGDALANNAGDPRVGAIVRISPERWAEGAACAVRDKARGAVVAEAHEILFHELVHAFRYVSKAHADRPVPLAGGLVRHSNPEEFIAVLVANIYASANGKRALRGAHHGHPALPSHLDSSFEFFRIGTQAFPVIEAFASSNKGFCRALAAVKAPFNPIRALFEDRERARRLSAGGMARGRDLRGLVLDLVDQLPLVKISDFERLMAP